LGLVDLELSWLLGDSAVLALDGIAAGSVDALDSATSSLPEASVLPWVSQYEASKVLLSL
jgi:hypothetical protein